ncbi:MAG: SRPBCC family protein [Rubrivivax sp.]|nr:SRPBCC family protein [Rubrivivax sp.]
MTVSVDIDLGYEFAVKASAKEVFAVLADVPKSASHFPKVKKLHDLGDNAYRWEMQRVGTAQIGIQTIYACKYKSDEKKGSVTWAPHPDDKSNAKISGSWKITEGKGRTNIVLKTGGTVDVALPALMKVVVGPVVTSEFEGLVEKYIENLCQTFGGEVE